MLGPIMTHSTCPGCGGYGIDHQRAVHSIAEGKGAPTRATRSPSTSLQESRPEREFAPQGVGDAGLAGGRKGDLYVEIREQPHEVFERRGDDLHCTLEVPMTAAALGTVTSVETFDGAKEVDIRPGTHAGTSIKLKGLGVGKLQRAGRGDLYVHLDVLTPTDLDDEQATLARRARGASR